MKVELVVFGPLLNTLSFQETLIETNQVLTYLDKLQNPVRVVMNNSSEKNTWGFGAI